MLPFKIPSATRPVLLNRDQPQSSCLPHSPLLPGPQNQSGPVVPPHHWTPESGRPCGTPALTWALVELACLGNVPLAESCPLANGGLYPIHLVLGNDGVQEDAPGEEEKPSPG